MANSQPNRPRPIANEAKFAMIHKAVCKSDLGSILPAPICGIIVEIRGVLEMRWSMVGEDVEISNNELTIRQIKSSRSAVADKIFKAGSGVYSWSIKVDSINRSGCKYIGVVRNNGLR